MQSVHENPESPLLDKYTVVLTSGAGALCNSKALSDTRRIAMLIRAGR